MTRINPESYATFVANLKNTESYLEFTEMLSTIVNLAPLLQQCGIVDDEYAHLQWCLEQIKKVTDYEEDDYSMEWQYKSFGPDQKKQAILTDFIAAVSELRKFVALSNQIPQNIRIIVNSALESIDSVITTQSE